jgi:hypothetical protein
MGAANERSVKANEDPVKVNGRSDDELNKFAAIAYSRTTRL